MLSFLTLDSIRVRVLLETTLDLVLLEMLLRLERDRLTESCWLPCPSALRIVFSKHVTDLSDVCLIIWSSIGIHAHLSIHVKELFVAPVKMIGDIHFNSSRFNFCDGLSEKDARRHNNHLSHQLPEVKLSVLFTHSVKNRSGSLAVPNVSQRFTPNLILDIV